jgi:hypothetical protein
VFLRNHHHVSFSFVPAAAEIILGKNNKRTAMNKEQLVGFEAEVPQPPRLAM